MPKINWGHPCTMLYFFVSSVMKVKEHLWSEPEHDLELIQENNMHISKMSKSKYFKKADVDPAILVTIKDITSQDVSMEGMPPDEQYIMSFVDQEKSLVLKPANQELCAIALKSEETDNWIGQQIVLFVDPNVMMGVKRVGGVRIRAKKAGNAEVKKEVEETVFNDDIPF